MMADEKPLEPPPLAMTMIGLGNFFYRLDPQVMAGVEFKIHEGGIVVSAYIPESQIRHMVRDEWS